MLNESLVMEIRRLLAADQLSNRRIARLLGVSRHSVNAIAAGTRPDYAALRRRRLEEEPSLSSLPERCRACGGRVYLPCQLCRVRNWLRVHRGVERFRNDCTHRKTARAGTQSPISAPLHAPQNRGG